MEQEPSLAEVKLPLSKKSMSECVLLDYVCCRDIIEFLCLIINFSYLPSMVNDFIDR